jgi:Ca2+-binding RTX toxin-like protein
MPTIGTNLDDILIGGAAGEEIHGGAGDDFIDGQDGSDLIYGEDGDDTIVGSVGAGSDYYDGGAGRDFVTYYDAFAGVRVNLSLTTNHAQSMNADDAGIGIDQLVNIEDVEGTRFDDSITGNSVANLLIGAEGNDSLSGGSGDDTLMPGLGDDVVNGGSGYDTVDYSDVNHAIYVSLDIAAAQSTGAGHDTLISIERVVGSAYNDVLGGNSLNNILYGMGGADRLSGGAGNDVLDGGTGADRMTGGLGNDTFYIDHASDLVFENAGEGTDTAIVTIPMSCALSANIENLTFTAAGPELDDGWEDAQPDQVLQLIGNASNNILTASDGANLLDGGAGADRMSGGKGEDHYIVDNIHDVVIEYADPGDGPYDTVDTVYSSVTYTISNYYVENLTLTGTANINGTGNGADNLIMGNDGANTLKGGWGYDQLYGGDGNDTLDGGAEVDMMAGGTGNDIYIVDNVDDQVTEGPGEGSDTIKASVSYQIGYEVENLQLTGSANINGYGNFGDDVITGNSGANYLSGSYGNDKLYGNAGNDVIDGGDGNDAIYGGSGADVLTGGTGADNFYFANGEFGGSSVATCDIIDDFSHVQGDHIRLNAVDANTAVAGDQAFSFIGTADFTGTAGELRYYVSGVDCYVQGDMNGDGVADFVLAVYNNTSLVTGDFVL